MFRWAICIKSRVAQASKLVSSCLPKLDIFLLGVGFGCLPARASKHVMVGLESCHVSMMAMSWGPLLLGVKTNAELPSKHDMFCCRFAKGTHIITHTSKLTSNCSCSGPARHRHIPGGRLQPNGGPKLRPYASRESSSFEVLPIVTSFFFASLERMVVGLLCRSLPPFYKHSRSSYVFDLGLWRPIRVGEWAFLSLGSGLLSIWIPNHRNKIVLIRCFPFSISRHAADPGAK